MRVDGRNVGGVNQPKSHIAGDCLVSGPHGCGDSRVGAIEAHDDRRKRVWMGRVWVGHCPSSVVARMRPPRIHLGEDVDQGAFRAMSGARIMLRAELWSRCFGLCHRLTRCGTPADVG